MFSRRTKSRAPPSDRGPRQAKCVPSAPPALASASTTSATWNSTSASAPSSSEKEKERFSACYARVSSAKQHDDLERQCAYLQQHYPEHRLYRDTGSGLNFKRPQFLALLEQVHAGLVREIVVADKERLCRFGWELVEWILDKAGTRLVVHRPPDWTSDTNDNPDVNHELSDDIISVITFFTARHYGQRSVERVVINYVKWESAERQEPNLSECHAHGHFWLTKAFVNEPVFGGLLADCTATPKVYLLRNARGLESFRVNDYRYTMLTKRLDYIEDGLKELRTHVRYIAVVLSITLSMMVLCVVWVPGSKTKSLV